VVEVTFRGETSATRVGSTINIPANASLDLLDARVLVFEYQPLAVQASSSELIAQLSRAARFAPV
jgi:hypothetical protein